MLVRHKDPLASVTTVLNRLVEYGEAQAVSCRNLDTGASVTISIPFATIGDAK